MTTTLERSADVVEKERRIIERFRVWCRDYWWPDMDGSYWTKEPGGMSEEEARRWRAGFSACAASLEEALVRYFQERRP